MASALHVKKSALQLKKADLLNEISIIEEAVKPDPREMYHCSEYSISHIGLDCPSGREYAIIDKAGKVCATTDAIFLLDGYYIFK
jgi:hypothetical protein